MICIATHLHFERLFPSTNPSDLHPRTIPRPSKALHLHPSPSAPAVFSRCLSSKSPSSRYTEVFETFRGRYSEVKTDSCLLSPHRVRTLTGKEIELDIEADYKVSETPTSVHQDLPYLLLRHSLQFQNEASAGYLSILSMLPSPCTPTRLSLHSNPLRLLTSGTRVIQVSRIKERVEEKEGIPPVQQRLIFGGKQMYVLRSIFRIYRHEQDHERHGLESDDVHES